MLVLKTLYPNLLKQAKNVYISGYYVSPPATARTEPTAVSKRNLDLGFLGLAALSSISAAPSRMQSPPLRPPSPPSTPPSGRQSNLVPYPPETAALAPAALASLIRTLLPPVRAAIPLFAKLEARILFPGEASYSSVWNDEYGPVVQMLRNTCGGRIDMEVLRGRTGNAIVLVTRPCPRSRVVSTNWGMLGSARDEFEGAVVGEKWGKGEEE